MARFVDIHTGAIGPSHDPYGYERITVKNDARTAVFYEDGLGRCKLELWETEDGAKVLRRKLEWHDVTYTKESTNKEALAKILFRRWVGLSIDGARQEYGESYEADPMGPLSRYI